MNAVNAEPADRPDLWPWSAVRGDDGQLHFGGLPVSQILADIPTPVYVLDQADFKGRAYVWATAMAEEFWDGYGMNGGRAYYAVKALPSGYAMREAVSAGMGVDTASLGELTVALQAGAAPEDVGLHGNNKSDEELRLAIQTGPAGIGRIVIDSEDEVERIGEIARELGRRARVMVRVTTGVHAGGHEFVATGHADQKFGLSLAAGDAKRVSQRAAAHPDLQFVGLHAHIGSQVFELEAFVQSATRLVGLVKELQAGGVPCGELDLGGGYAVAYTAADPVAPSQRDVARRLAEVIRSECTSAGVPVPLVSIEPGRSVVAPSVVTLYRVGTVKPVPTESGRRIYVSVDGGMSDNIRPALYGARYSAILANRTSPAPLVDVRIVGKHCESGDIIAAHAALPQDVRRGDVLAVPVTGAYGHALASNYNLLPRPGTLGVENGHKQWIIYPEQISDLMVRDAFINERTAP